MHFLNHRYMCSLQTTPPTLPKWTPFITAKFVNWEKHPKLFLIGSNPGTVAWRRRQWRHWVTFLILRIFIGMLSLDYAQTKIRNPKISNLKKCLKQHWSNCPSFELRISIYELRITKNEISPYLIVTNSRYFAIGQISSSTNISSESTWSRICSKYGFTSSQ